jgi:hypothetical protein
MIQAILLATLLTGPAHAAAPECVVILNDADRLACYDAAYRMPAATSTAAVATTPAPASAPTAPVTPANPEAEFGLTIEEKDKRRGIHATDRISSRVTTVESNRSGKDSFQLENGQRWIQTDISPRPPIKTGDIVEIRRASLGSFLASVPGSGQPAVRVRRLE